MSKEIRCEILVVGGGLGGCAATLSALRLGRKVILTEETDWIGGQLTSQAVSAPDEHPWIESFGGTETYYRLRNGIRRFYRNQYPLLPSARQKIHLNPGNGDVSHLCHEPRVALAMLEQMLAPYFSAGQLLVYTRYKPMKVDVEGDSICSVTFQNMIEGTEKIIHAPFIIDATELGDLLPLTKTEYVVGAESQSDTGEPHAVSGPAEPDNVQSFTYCFVMDYLPDGEYRIPKPEGYEKIRDTQPLQWLQPHPVTLQPRTYCLFEELEGDAYSLWNYRRILDKSQFTEGFFSSDLSLVNWPMNDFCGGNIIDKPKETVDKLLKEAKLLSLSLLYWLQTEAPRADGGFGFSGLRLRSDVVGTEDGLAQYPYIREARRIKPVFRILEQHVASDIRKEQYAESFADSVGIGLYRIDLHPSSLRKPYLDIGCCPFQIPLGALIPIRVKNLIAGNKNIGTTHITNGAYRLHPVEWNIGESAGALAAFCLNTNTQPLAVREKENFLKAYQKTLTNLGITLHWPEAKPV
jgi:hypothetical protein